MMAEEHEEPWPRAYCQQVSEAANLSLTRHFSEALNEIEKVHAIWRDNPIFCGRETELLISVEGYKELSLTLSNDSSVAGELEALFCRLVRIETISGDDLLDHARTIVGKVRRLKNYDKQSFLERVKSSFHNQEAFQAFKRSLLDAD